MRLRHHAKSSFCTLGPETMEEKHLHLNYHSVSHPDGLGANDRALFAKAVEAMQSAYAPYSRFSVGAAVLLQNGVVVQGSNQENMAYPSGLCAERVALFSAAANHPGVPVKAIAIAAHTQNPEATVSPCGACRQVMMEYQRLSGGAIRIITGAAQGKVMVIDDAGVLLPLAFFDPGLQKDSKPEGH